jgi:hypothetical protein
MVEGALSVATPGSSLNAEHVNGDVSLNGTLQDGGEYTIHAEGAVRVMVDGNVHFTVRSESGIELGEGLTVTQDADGTMEGHLGDPERAAHLVIEANGTVCLNNPECFESRHVRHRHRHHHRHHHRRDRHYEREVEAEVRQAMAEARAEMKRAQETLRAEMKRAMRDVDAEVDVGRVGDVVRSTVRDFVSALRPMAPIPPIPPVPPVAPMPPQRSASERNTRSEEVMTILRMLQEGRITADQAEQLIRALD